MAKHVFRLIIKIVLFAAIMLLVARGVPYEGWVDSITSLFDFRSADKITRFILGQPNLEVRESLGEYFSILINTLISVPVMSAVIIAYRCITNQVRPADIPRKWLSSTLRGGG